MAFSNNHTLISRATKIVGDLHFTGELQVEGKVTGNILADDAKDAKVVIADTGVVEGEIRAPVVVVNGKIFGDVHSGKHLELAAKGVVNGVVHYHSIEMVKGAQVNGSMISNQTSELAAIAPAQNAKDAGKDAGKEKLSAEG